MSALHFASLSIGGKLLNMREKIVSNKSKSHIGKVFEQGSKPECVCVLQFS